MLPESSSLVHHITAPRLDRHGQERRDDDWLAGIWQQPHTRVLHIDRGKAPVIGSTGPEEAPLHTSAPRLLLTAPQGPLPATAVYLGEVAEGESHTFAGDAPVGHVITVPIDSSATDDHHELRAQTLTWETLRTTGHLLPALEAELLTYAAAVTAWHASSTFCSGCGGATEPHSSGWDRRCTQCGASHYPRTDPAVITAVTDTEDRLLLGSAHRWDSSRFSTFAGFAEAGESLEDAVVREVMEEAGVAVESVEYIGSQAWPFPRSLMVGFVAHISDAAATADDEEIREVRWFTRQELHDDVTSGAVTLPPRSAVSHALITHWYGSALPEGPSDSPAPR